MKPLNIAVILAVLGLAGAMVHAADTAAPADKPAFKPEELEQMLAPIALYPDSVLTQMLMASTYPLEVVQADRWAKQNPTIKDAALTKALESQSWDASVKSLVNFPPVLAMMSEKLDLTVKIGDAFIGQQKQVLETIQKLRAKAQETGNLKTTAEQTVVVEKQVIVIQAADPKVVYIPTYPPTVYYVTWPYPAYPPAPYYPPGYVAGRAVAFTAGVAVGAAWGYAWGHSNWHGGSVDIDVSRNANINANINRSNYATQYQARNTAINNKGQGNFQHDAAHRQGVAYRNQATATQYGRTSAADAAKSRESFRGRTDAGGLGGGLGNRPSTGGPGSSGLGGGTSSGLGNRPSTGGPGSSGLGGGTSGGLGNRPSTGASQLPASSGRQNAFSGINSGGSAARSASSRGSVSRSSSPSRSAPSRSGGGRR